MQKNKLSTVEEIRKRASRDMEQGPVTPTYGTDPQQVIELLQAALATETVCVLRYRNHYAAAEGLEAGPVADEFLEHAIQEQRHAERIAARISQLGGTPDLNPATLLERSHAEYKTGETLREMIEINLMEERVAIESYREIIQFLGDSDPTTRRLMEKVLEDEEEHAEDMRELLHEDKVGEFKKTA